MPTTLRLYRFRFHDRVRGGWVRAGYVAEYPVLTRRYESFEVLGPPELREVPDDWRALTAGHLARGQEAR